MSIIRLVDSVDKFARSLIYWGFLLILLLRNLR